jgi:hypothetical protein
MMRHGHSWTPEEDAKLRDLAAADMPVRSIALKLRRSENGVLYRAGVLNVNVQTNLRRRAATGEKESPQRASG